MGNQRKAGPKTLRVINGWEVRRSTIPGNYNLTHEVTKAKSGKIAGWDKVIKFIDEHSDGKVELVTIGGKKFSKPKL